MSLVCLSQSTNNDGVNIDIPDNSTNITNGAALQHHNVNDDVVSHFISSTLSLRDSMTTYSPFLLGLYLTQHHDTIIDCVKITKSKIIDHLISKNLIPVKKTSAYKVEGYVSLGLIPEFSSWTDITKNGRKAILTNMGSNYFGGTNKDGDQRWRVHGIWQN